jgi:general secretion pathway protein N
MSLRLNTSGTPRWIYWVGSIVVGLIVLLWQLPARWVLASIGTQTQCKVLIESPAGSIWQGSAAIGFSEPSIDGKTCRPALAVTERLYWDMSCQLLSPGCNISIDTPALIKPLRISIQPGVIRVADNEARLPAEILEVLGAPWTLLHPRAQLHARWTDLVFQEPNANGNIRISLNNLVSPISQIQPLGSYDVQAELSGDAVNYTLSTSKGPLLLQAQGMVSHHGTTGQGEANATPEMKEALTGLLNLIGKRQGDTYRLVF